MKRSTAIAVMLAALVIIVAIVVLAAVLWGRTGIRVVAISYMLIGAPLFLRAHKGRMRWEVIVLGVGYFILAAGFATSWLAREPAAAQMLSTILVFVAAACIWTGAIAYCRRLLHQRRHPSTRPPTTQGA